MKKKIISEIYKRIKGTNRMIKLIYDCCQQEEQKVGLEVFKFKIKELKDLRKFISKLKK